MSDQEEIMTELAVLESRFDGQENRFDKHLAIYAANGHALKELTTAVHDVKNSVQQMIETQGVCGAKVALLHEEYLEKMSVSKALSGWGRNTIMIGGTIGASIVIIASIKSILGI